MKTIQLTITLPRCQSPTSAYEIAQGIAAHRFDTFNDDQSLGSIRFTRVPTPPQPKTTMRATATVAS